MSEDLIREVASAFVPPAVEALNEDIGKNYEVIELLGAGGMGAVYKARQPKLDRIVAIKLLRPIDDLSGQIKAGFAREAQSMAKLDHPHIVSVYDFDETASGMNFFAMEHTEGTDLHELISSGQLTQDHTVGWIPQICDALGYAHDKGMVHRDIKPANILVSLESQVKVVDFGLVSNGGADDGIALGTPDYSPPEMFEDYHGVDHRADIFSLGVVTYEMLTGNVPGAVWVPPSQAKQGVDPRWDNIVLRAMQPDPNQRYSKMSTFARDVKSLVRAPAPKKQPSGQRLVTQRQPISQGVQASPPNRLISEATGRVAISNTSVSEAPSANLATGHVNVSAAASETVAQMRKSQRNAKIRNFCVLGALVLGGLAAWKHYKGDKPVVETVEVAPVDVTSSDPGLMSLMPIPVTGQRFAPSADGKMDAFKGSPEGFSVIAEAVVPIDAMKMNYLLFETGGVGSGNMIAIVDGKVVVIATSTKDGVVSLFRHEVPLEDKDIGKKLSIGVSYALEEGQAFIELQTATNVYKAGPLALGQGFVDVAGVDDAGIGQFQSEIPSVGLEGGIEKSSVFLKPIKPERIDGYAVDYVAFPRTVK